VPLLCKLVPVPPVVEEGGIVNVFGIWFGLSLITVLTMLVIMGIGQLFI